jgi:thioredoxin-related protein
VARKPYRSLVIIVLVFAVFWVTVFLKQKRTPIAWVTDYQAGVETARQQNKPLLLVFYKPNARLYNDASRDTYVDPKVKEYVESTFVPVLINVVESPQLEKKFKIGYYPTHYVKWPDSDELAGPRVGHDPPDLFMSEMQKLLDKLNNSAK